MALAGVHGKVNGHIGHDADRFVRWTQNQANKLKVDNASDVEQLNVEIKVVDVGVYKDREVLDKEALVQVIKKMSPTVIVLTFCFTDKSVLNDIFAEAGVYSAMFLDSNRTKITPLVQQEPDENIANEDN